MRHGPKSPSRSKRACSLTLVLMLIVSPMVALSSLLIFAPTPVMSASPGQPLGGLSAGGAAALTPHTPIYIGSDGDFTRANGVVSGSGTSNDPYIIEGWVISAEGDHGIWIGHTSAYFVIRNCLVENGRTYFTVGITLNAVWNGRVEYCTLNNNHGGIVLYFSSNCIVKNNGLSNNKATGIDLDESSNITVKNNNVGPNNGFGIYLTHSSMNTIEGNTSSNNEYGIYSIYSPNNTILNNNLSSNSDRGICLIDSSNNTIVNNEVSSNRVIGIDLSDSNNNRIYHNNLRNNGSQAWDDNSNYWDNGYPSGGNYWGDYGGEDRFYGENQDLPGSDGIGDTPYLIHGGNNRDRYPFTQPTQLPPVGAATFTSLLISPSSFTLQTGNSTTLTATLKDENGNPVPSKSITWSATAGSLSATSGTTNPSGQASVTYTAPTATAQTSVTITASFAGDGQYGSSSGTSSGTITVAGVIPTSLSISPPSFTLQSGGSTTLTATLYDDENVGLADKLINWSATSGSVSPSSDTTDSYGQVSVTYTAPSVTAQTSVTITASFAGDDEYQESSGTSSGTITVAGVIPTSLSISPPSFTLQSGGSTTLTATWAAENATPDILAGKTISWSAVSGSDNDWTLPVHLGSSTTDSEGKASITYTAPTVTTQASAIVIASFAGNTSYQSSSGNSSGTIEPITIGETTMSISPQTFALYPGYSGQVQSLVATLRDGSNNPLAGKTITWSATLGSVSPSSGTTNALGQVTVTYTAPTVTAATPRVTIIASFVGDAQYGSSSATSSGVPAAQVSQNIPASTGGTVVINIIEINVTINVLVVPPNALPENKTVTVVQAPPENLPGYNMVSHIFDIGPSGTNFTTPSMLTLPYNENELPEGVSEDNLAIYRRTSSENWERVGGNVDKVAKTVSVQINHLSEYAVMAELAAAPQGEATPAEGIPLAVLAVVGVALMVAISAAWVGLRRARGDATSELIKHGLSSMSIQDADIFREIRGHKEFTIPELMRETGASKTVAWYTVQKLIKKGLVQPTGEVKQPAAGRGKPSTVYKYVGD